MSKYTAGHRVPAAKWDGNAQEQNSKRVLMLLHELLWRFRNQFVLQLMTAMSVLGY